MISKDEVKAALALAQESVEEYRKDKKIREPLPMMNAYASLAAGILIANAKKSE